MDKYTSTLLPYILDLLSRQPELRIPMDDIIKHIQDAVMFEHVRPFGSLRNAVDVAIGVGETTGVLTLIDEEVTPKARKLTKKRTPKTRSRSARTRKATTCRHLGKNKGGRVAKAPKRR
ncbi:uncharacterized protein [Drosophila bipectinata]|uniref:uncharacterized protein n=1 Tax=Drosophila bipectinata TaxID=42026 RepID=UPI0007E87B87|nr:uncharacterized protein LOC108127318 [Drosophila bipectinata]